MDIVLFVTGIVQISISLMFGVLFIYAAFRVFHKIIRDIDDIKELARNNIAVSILNASVIFSIILIVRSSIDPAVTIFANNLRSPASGFIDYTTTALLMLAQIILSGIIAFVSIFIALKFFMWLTKDLNEIDEIRKNNIAVSIVMAVVIISIALLLEPGIKTLLESLIPFPKASFLDIG